MSAITSRSDIVVVDIYSTRKLWNYGFLAEVFESFRRRRLSVDLVATSEVSVSLTLNKNVDILSPSQSTPSNRAWAEACEDEGLRGVIEDLSDIADIELKPSRSIITLIANVEQSSNVIGTAFNVLTALGIQVEMLSQGASKVNISLVVPGDKEKEVIMALHKCFFEDECAAQ